MLRGDVPIDEFQAALIGCIDEALSIMRAVQVGFPKSYSGGFFSSGLGGAKVSFYFNVTEEGEAWFNQVLDLFAPPTEPEVKP